MNVFVLDYDPVICAQWHCDRHVVKMILETAQILCTSIANVCGDDYPVMYKPTHRRHPCTVWAQDLRNWVWLRNLGFALCDEYTHRYGKVHKSLEVLQSFPIPTMKLHTPKTWALAMPNEHKQECPIASYRSYYQTKQHQFKMCWTVRDVPEWFEFEPVQQSLSLQHAPTIEDQIFELRLLDEKGYDVTEEIERLQHLADLAFSDYLRGA